MFAEEAPCRPATLRRVRGGVSSPDSARQRATSVDRQVGHLHIRTQADEVGVSVITAAARACIQGAGGDPDAAAVIVYLLAADADRRTYVDSESEYIALTIDVVEEIVSMMFVDNGEPRVGEPDCLAPLIQLELVKSAVSTIIDRSVHTSVTFPLGAGMPTLVEGEEPGPGDESVSFRPGAPGDGLEVSRLFYRCYGWTYGHGSMYAPDSIDQAIQGGTRLVEVACSDSGDIVAHWAFTLHGPHLVESGMTVTDPRYRRRGIGKKLLGALIARAHHAGILGIYGEPVLTNVVSQMETREGGGFFCGLRVDVFPAMNAVGISTRSAGPRLSLLECYIPLRPLEPASIFIPEGCTGFVSDIVSAGSLPRTLQVYPPPDYTMPDATVLSVSDIEDERALLVVVDQVGADAADRLSEILDSARVRGAACVEVSLPAFDPGAANLDLRALHLAFCAFIPMASEAGDVLMLQWVAAAVVDTSNWQLLDQGVRDHVEAIVAHISESCPMGDPVQPVR